LLNEGYRVIDARDGMDALHVAQAEPAPLDLLLTDRRCRKWTAVIADSCASGSPISKSCFSACDSLFADRAMLEENTRTRSQSRPRLNEAVRLLLFGTLGYSDGIAQPAFDDLPVATSESEYLRIPLVDGGWSRVLFSGADPSCADIEAVIDALQRRLQSLREAEG
jgi:hypothetical protein